MNKVLARTPTPLERLPPELLFQILALLPPVSLSRVLRANRCLHAHACNDRLWEALVRQNVPYETPVTSPFPARSWRQLYISHHPYWFLVRHKLWFSDCEFTGDLILARYVPETGAILAHKVLAMNATRIGNQWSHDSGIIICHFKPQLQLFEDEAIINLEYNDEQHQRRDDREIDLPTGQVGVRSTLSLCRPMPLALQDRSMALWPPFTIPSTQRVRNESPSMFRASASSAMSPGIASDMTFRLRKWPGRSNLLQPYISFKIGERLSTWSTLSKEFLRPSSHKPFQGIFVGDYISHGCEILLVLQRLDRVSQREMVPVGPDFGLPAGFALVERGEDHLTETNVGRHRSTNRTEAPNDQDLIYEGGLEAIKLTGDVNIPRGQISWIANDIGDGGLIRIADDDEFRGSRIVKSMAHVAYHGFRSDRFIRSQLILQSRDHLLQYWEGFGHISSYKRVDLDALLSHGTGFTLSP